MKLGYNLGSGQRPSQSVPGSVEWINVDSQSKWNPTWCGDAASTPFDSGEADYVVLHHVLEHFGCGEGRGLLAEAHRLLKPYGSLLIFVPDLRALAQRWLAGGLSTQIYATNLYGAYMGHEDDRHKWGFDRDSLTQELDNTAANIKWGRIKPFDWRTIPGADIAKDFWIIGVECVK